MEFIEAPNGGFRIQVPLEPSHLFYSLPPMLREHVLKGHPPALALTRPLGSMALVAGLYLLWVVWDWPSAFSTARNEGQGWLALALAGLPVFLEVEWRIWAAFAPSREPLGFAVGKGQLLIWQDQRTLVDAPLAACDLTVDGLHLTVEGPGGRSSWRTGMAPHKLGELLQRFEDAKRLGALPDAHQEAG